MNISKITFKSIWHLVLEKRSYLIWGQIVTLIAILVSIPIPLMLPVLVDEILLKKPDLFVNTIDTLFGEGTPFYYIAIVAFAVIFLRVSHFLLSAVITKIFTKIAKFVTFEIRRKLLEHLKLASISEYESLGSGAVGANLVTDVNTLEGFITSGASKFVSSMLTLLAISIVMILIDPILGCMILVIQPIVILISKRISKSVGGLKKDENKAVEDFQNNINETLDLFGQIKASNKENYFFNIAKQKAKKIQTTSNEYGYKSVAYERFSFTIFLVAFEIFRATGLILVAYSDLSIGMMFAMFGYIWFIMTPIQDVLSIQYSYAVASGALERINKILDLELETNGKENLKVQENALEISLKGIDFEYIKDKPILKSISFDIEPRSKIALIGASGSGKTTLAQIISGFYDKKSGALKYNGVDVERLLKSSIRENIFLILQMPILFNQTLRFNITMGDESISDEKIMQALKIAQLKEMLDDMPDHLDTIVGKHGIKLSGGQRQRLSIARMIIADPAVVIFDESTSALDVHTEAKLYSDLVPILKDKTVITIAHRLSTVKKADKIYVLDDGKIVESGTHDELEFNEGHYTEFLKKQLI